MQGWSQENPPCPKKGHVTLLATRLEPIASKLEAISKLHSRSCYFHLLQSLKGHLEPLAALRPGSQQGLSAARAAGTVQES